MNAVELVWIDHSIAYRIGDTIYMNYNLLKYPEFMTKTLMHEMKHSLNYQSKDFLLDIKESTLWDNILFCLKNPRGFIGFLPFAIHNKKLAIDITQLTIYAIFAVILWVILN